MSTAPLSEAINHAVIQTLADLSRLVELLFVLSRAPAAGLPLDELIEAVAQQLQIPGVEPLPPQIEERLRQLVDSAVPVGIFELDSSGPRLLVRPSKELREIAAGISRFGLN